MGSHSKGSLVSSIALKMSVSQFHETKATRKANYDRVPVICDTEDLQEVLAWVWEKSLPKRVRGSWGKGASFCSLCHWLAAAWVTPCWEMMCIFLRQKVQTGTRCMHFYFVWLATLITTYCSVESSTESNGRTLPATECDQTIKPEKSNFPLLMKRKGVRKARAETQWLYW